MKLETGTLADTSLCYRMLRAGDGRRVIIANTAMIKLGPSGTTQPQPSF